MKNTLKYNKYLLILFLFFISLSVTVSSGCFENEDIIKVSFEDTEILNEAKSDSLSFKIGVYSMYSPRTAIDYYEDFFEYLSESSDIDFELVQRDDPAELLYLLESHNLDAVFIRKDDYSKGYDDFGMEIISIPVLHGDIYYYSYVIAHSNSDISSIEDLRDKSFAFNSFRFTHGSIVPEYMADTVNGSPDDFFSSYIYSNSQDNFIDMVSQGSIDAAEVDCVVWEYLVENSLTELKIIHRSPPQLVPVIAVNPDIDAGSKEEFSKLLLSMHKSPKGRKVLENMGYDMFIEIDPDMYINEII